MSSFEQYNAHIFFRARLNIRITLNVIWEDINLYIYIYYIYYYIQIAWLYEYVPGAYVQLR